MVGLLEGVGMKDLEDVNEKNMFPKFLLCAQHCFGDINIFKRKLSSKN